MKKNRSNRFFLFLLVSILLLMQQTAYAYFFFTIHYSDGTKSEPFYKTDVDSICYSKIDLFGEEKNDYIIQEIWMGDSVCRIPLSLIDSISYTKVDDAVTARSVQGVLKQMDSLSSAGETIGSDASLETLASLDGVEDVYASGSNVFVKIKNWGSVTYYKAPHYDITTDTEPQATRSNAARLLSSSLSDHEHYNYRNACILNQHYRDNYFSSSKRIAADLKSSFEDVGIGCDIINNPSTDFFSDDNLGIGGKMREDKIYDYDIVFINTHGCYDERHHLHWILTSDELFNSVVGNTSSDDHTEILVRLIKSLSPRKIGIGYVKELRDRPRNVCYVSISQEYIRSSSRSFKCDGNAIVFNTACQSMKGDTGLGDAFISKGAGCYLGYNDTNSIGDGAGNEYFNMLLNGKSVVDAYQNLPNRFLTENLYENRKGEFFGSKTAGMDVVNEYHPILRMLSSGKNLCVVAPVLLPVTELYNGDYSVKISAQLRMQNPYGARAQGNSYYFLVSKNSDMSNAEKHEVYKYDENEFSFNDKTHTLTISHTFKEKDLKPLTTYFYCAVLEDKHGECRSDVEKFEIKGNGEVITLEASYAKADIAQLYGQFNFSVPIGDAGFYIGMSRDLSEYVNISVSQAAGMTNGSFYNYVIGLHPSRTYYYKAYVTVDGKTYFGETLPLNTSWVIDGEITDSLVSTKIR